MGNLKALIVILCLALATFWLARAPVCAQAVHIDDFRRRRNLWLAFTLVAFFSYSFWIYLFVGALLAVAGSQREPNRMSLFLALMLVIPPFVQTIPGIGDIQQVISINNVRMLSIVLLLPAYLMIRRSPGALPFGRTAADKCLIGYLLLQLVLQASVLSTTALVRAAIYSFVDVFLPYYVASRGLRELREYRDTLMTFVLVVVLMAPMAMFESSRHWLLYNELTGTLGVPATGMGDYMVRGGNIRATVTSEHSIALGYLAVAGLGSFVFAQRYVSSLATKAIALSFLVFMLIATGARGPWVGAFAVLCLTLLSGPDKINRIFKTILIALPVLAALSFTDFGQRVFSLLPFIGTADGGSIDYRQRLFDISVPVILQHPWFGAFDYLVNPAMQELIQGEGIIDVVNSFLGVALTFGGVGLSLFCGVFLFAGWNVWSACRHSETDSEERLLGRSLLVTVAGIMITIYTVSSIGVIAWIYWLFAGFCVGYAQLMQRPATEEAAVRSPIGRLAPLR